MKKNTHPEYFQATVSCGGCGTTFTVGSTKSTLAINVCSKCHPFYTGNQRLVDTAGRVERFNKKYGKPASTSAA